jgi:hypothetical protein
VAPAPTLRWFQRMVEVNSRIRALGVAVGVVLTYFGVLAL